MRCIPWEQFIHIAFVPLSSSPLFEEVEYDSRLSIPLIKEDDEDDEVDEDDPWLVQVDNTWAKTFLTWSVQRSGLDFLLQVFNEAPDGSSIWT